MNFFDVTSKEQWEQFQKTQPFAQFLQSWAWGEFRETQGGAVRRIALVDEKSQWLAAVQFEYRARRFGTGYWFAPRGPVFSTSLAKNKRRDVTQTLSEQMLKRLEFQQKTLFWRMEPMSELDDHSDVAPPQFRRVASTNPSSTVVLDLTPSIDDLLAGMHEKTRYNVRLAERKGVKVRVADTPEDVENFLNLMDETASRDKFIQHSRAYLRSTYDFLHAKGMGQIRLAEYNGKILSANLEVSYGDTVTYLYGASSSEERNVMAPFALHWDAIQDAKRRGFRLYDFWGANPESKDMPDYKSSWEGITRFKSGWGGRLVNLVGTWDLPMKPLAYRLAFLKDFFRR